MTTHDTTFLRTLGLVAYPGSQLSWRASLDRARRRLREMAKAIRTRRLLAQMDGRELADVGIGPGDAMMEASRRPWDVKP
jgi:uncharacterized protein YjiS (DUF1127 family)